MTIATREISKIENAKINRKFHYSNVIGFFLGLCLSFLLFNAQAYADSLTRMTEYGSITGMVGKENTTAWLGVPYAAAPTGKLRWKAPVDPTPWESLQTTRFKEYCMQIGHMALSMNPHVVGKAVGNEDCLYLNIWRPEGDEENLPVFLWMHLGKNFMGAAGLEELDGANLANTAKMIVITVDYRLGQFGWFYNDRLVTENALDDSGNYGLLDLIKALQWIKNNAQVFGGNAQNVTIAGQSTLIP